MRVLTTIFKLVWALFVVSLPLLGVWIASSIAAFSNGPRWLVVLAGGLLFPVLPLVWDAISNYRRRHSTRRRFLTFGDRLMLRTLFLNVVFLAALGFASPRTAFTALSARGDWMLDGRHGPVAERTRSVLFGAAEHLEWLYLASTDNPYEIEDEDGVVPPPLPEPSPATVDAGIEASADAGFDAGVDAGLDAGVDAGFESPDATPVPEPPPAPIAKTVPTWPLPAELHPITRAITEEAATDYRTVARYILEHEPDPYLRAKAIHDYVAETIAYDHVSLAKDEYPSYRPDDVFAQKTGVCAGYAKLFQAMSKEAGLTAAYVVGKVRDQGAMVDGEGHAWNAIELEGHWYLVDVTWDSPHSNDPKKQQKSGVRSSYFLTPPEVFGLDHFPDDERWQLRERPLSRGEFIRQPAMGVGFYMAKMQLVTPDRSSVTVAGVFDLELENPLERYVLVSYRPRGDEDGNGQRCEVENGRSPKARCRFPNDDIYQVRLFAGEKEYGTYEYVGEFHVSNELRP